MDKPLSIQLIPSNPINSIQFVKELPDFQKVDDLLLTSNLPAKDTIAQHLIWISKQLKEEVKLISFWADGDKLVGLVKVERLNDLDNLNFRLVNKVNLKQANTSHFDMFVGIQPISCLEDYTCPVCLDHLQFDNDEALVLLVCNHMFHSNCLIDWAGSRCPMCRYTHSTQSQSNKQTNCSFTNCNQLPLYQCLTCTTTSCQPHSKTHFTQTNHPFSLFDNLIHNLLTHQPIYDAINQTILSDHQDLASGSNQSNQTELRHDLMEQLIDTIHLQTQNFEKKIAEQQLRNDKNNQTISELDLSLNKIQSNTIKELDLVDSKNQIDQQSVEIEKKEKEIIDLKQDINKIGKDNEKLTGLVKGGRKMKDDKKIKVDRFKKELDNLINQIH